MDTERLLVLICTYNEGDNLPRLFAAISAACPQADVLLVDDGSKDQTHRWIADNADSLEKLRVINRGGKLGLGTAIRDGLLYAVENRYDWCINLDADLSHDPAAIPQLLAARGSDGSASGDSANTWADLVIGSRYVPGGGMVGCSWQRVLVSRSVNAIARAMIGWPFRDCSSAYRCYRVAAVADLQLQSIDNASYGFLEEILWRIWIRNGRIVESPITYVDREAGQSKISISEAWQTWKTLWRLRRLQRRLPSNNDAGTNETDRV